MARITARRGTSPRPATIVSGCTSRRRGSDTGDELFFLAATFNDMIARLEHMLESQRRLLADTSHELRNPITIIRGNLALLRRERVPESSRGARRSSKPRKRRRGWVDWSATCCCWRAPTRASCRSCAASRVDLAELATEVVDQARPTAGDRDAERHDAGVAASCSAIATG